MTVDLFAGVPVSDYSVALAWYERLFGAAARLADGRAAAVDPAGALIGVVERRGDDIKSAMNMPEGT